MAKFTGGDWEVKRHGITYEVWVGNYCVAKGIYNKANAYLLVAAPDMYKKLTKVKKWLKMLLANAEAKLKTERFITLREAYKRDIANYKATIADIDRALVKAEGKP